MMNNQIEENVKHFKLNYLLYPFLLFITLLFIIFYKSIFFLLITNIPIPTQIIDEVYYPQYDLEYINPFYFDFEIVRDITAADYSITYIRDNDTIIIGKAIINNIEDNNIEVEECRRYSEYCILIINGERITIDFRRESYQEL